MSISDCIQINENQFYSNPNLVLHYGNINCNTEVRSGNNLLYGRSNQHSQNSKHDNSQNQADFSFSLISHSNKKPDIDELHINVRKENLKNHYNNLPTDEISSQVKHKSMHKNSSKSIASKSPENKIVSSKLNDQITTEIFPNNESNGPTAKKCKVCFDKAVNQNFGVLSCESCKAFFRRNAIRTTPLKCSNGTDACSVTSSTRKQCPSCRLKKCLQVGMKSELIQIRKNNPKINLGKRKSNTTPQDGTVAKWINQGTNCSNSSGRLSQDNIEDTLKISNDMSLVPNVISENSPLISAGLWINTTNYQYQISNQHNLWLPMNLDQQCNESLNCNILTTNCITPINGQSFASTFDPIKYDVQIPMIKIKTHHNIIQPIAVLPTTSIYESPNNVQSILPIDLKSKPTKLSKDPLLASEMLKYSEIPMQSIYQYDLSNYSLSNNTSKPSIGDNNSPSAFYPFTVHPSVSTSQTAFFNGVETANTNSYLWECPNQNSESSTSNDHSNSFMSIDSGSDTFFYNPTYPGSNSSQKIYLSPDQFEILESHPCFLGIEEENTENEDYQGFSVTDEFEKHLKLHSEIYLLPDSILLSDQRNFIFEIGQIWESTLGRAVIFQNPNNVPVHLNLNHTNSDGFQSFAQFPASDSWDSHFYNLTDIFIRQIKLFFDKIIETLSCTNDLGHSLKTELTYIMENQSNETLLLIIIPIIFSNLITKFPSVEEDYCQIDKEDQDHLFSVAKSNTTYSETMENSMVYFSVIYKDPLDNSNNLTNAHIDLTLLSTRFLELDNIKYSSLQYLDKYCSGLSNFLNPTPVFYGLYALLKIISAGSKDDFYDLSWNTALLRRESSPVSVNGTKSKLMYDLKSIFVSACNIVQSDTVEQRLHSLDQFLSWSKSQFDLQWIEFFISTKTHEDEMKTNDFQLIQIQNPAR